MKQQKVKNLICALILIALIGLTAFTIYQGKNSMNNQSTPTGTPPSAQNSTDENSDTSTQATETAATSTDTSAQTADTSSNQSSDSSGTQSTDNSQSTGETPPELPDGASMTGSTLPTRYIIFLGLESLGIAMTALYLILSRGNSRSFRETFVNGDKVAIMVLGSIVGMGALTAAEILIFF